MTPEFLLEKFGYVAVFLGSFLEGEAILVMAGFFGERGLLDLSAVIVLGFLGAYCGHIFWFWLGRTKGTQLLERFPRMKLHFGKGIRMFERYGASAIFLTQWIYGLRITCAVIIGMSRIPLAKFLLYEGITCAIWATVIASLGYSFGRAVEVLLGRVAHLEKWGLLAIALVAIAFWIRHRRSESAAER
ncbi:MAG TPA: DedA family protein [Thermoanaerobaculia bacterium]|nr:DedA family protein [Thermoanaerobaculia bacterium]